MRYWSLSAKLGVDTTFDEKVLKVGRRLVTKLFNAAKYVLGQDAPGDAITHSVDKGFMRRLGEVAREATAAFEEQDYATALGVTERFFWSRFTDAYLEIVKARARSETDAAGRASAVAALHQSLGVFLRLFAPFLPYVAEEAWSWTHGEGVARSIHRAAWPEDAEFAAVGGSEEDAAIFDAAALTLEAIHRAKSAAGATVGRHVDRLVIRAGADVEKAVRVCLPDVLAAARVQDHAVEVIAGGGIEVADMELAEAAPGEPAPPAA